MESSAKPDFISKESPIHRVECPASWNQLTDTEKNYAYYFSQAAWEGAKICYFQRSYEAPALFLVFNTIFRGDLAAYKARVLEAGLTEDDWKAFTVYVAAVFQNCGNYKSFGDSKFVPELEKEKLVQIIKLSPSYGDKSEVIDRLWAAIETEVFAFVPPYQEIGFKDNKGHSSYYSSNIEKADIDFINEFAKTIEMDPITTRLFKTETDGNVHYHLRLASSVTDDEGKLDYLKEYTHDGKKVTVARGDFAVFLGKVADNLSKAAEFAANETQKQMINAYVEHFKFGDVNKHKDSQRFWIKDLNPAVETNIGFIETYLDPAGVRAEFEGFVSIVDKESSKQFGELVTNAEKIIPFLPWPENFEKDKFLKPDFTNLMVLAFGCSGTPLGINIPNYDDIRQTDGFKNVNLANVYPKAKASRMKFLSEEDIALICKHDEVASKIHTALHELLGHGTGKLFSKNKEGALNFKDVTNPLTGEAVTKYYEANETYDYKFGSLSSSYEECRADTVGIYLALFDQPLEIFAGEQKENWEDITYVMWMSQLLQGFRALEYYNPESKKWGQAHVMGRYVTMRVLHEAGLVDITFTEDDTNMIVSLKRDLLRTDGKDAVGKFLTKLQVYKSSGDSETGLKMYQDYSQVDEFFLKIRNIVLRHKLPRRLELQPHLSKESESVNYADFEETFEGIITSYQTRYPEFDQEMLNLWDQDRESIRM
eukprot:CAMPEP_0114997242 /NCGR_PEP_ID=MMETSP0216-20121206/14785_1 /TAXON_ID=223996 /ORGANISM="Protocruzia adherens, Strain Boccale" /LENGTH=708 /DNA_ID=CAMNT_0002361591 /DNA_START=1606 /DNA_END=3732 /DNA_ORIENTATION=-